MKRLTPQTACGVVALAVWAGVTATLQGPGARASRDGEHEHASHAHRSVNGGTVQAVGDHHVEARIEPDGRVSVFLMGAEETDLWPIPAKTLPAEAQSGRGGAVHALTLRALPQPGEPDGESSRFVGMLPKALAGRPVYLTVTVPLGGGLRRVRFAAQGEPARGTEEESHAAMPTSLAQQAGAGEGEGPTAAERDLFLTPGGLYTVADIAANRGQTPAERFRGIAVAHDSNPPKGAPLCPITATKANPRLPWIVGGKRYLFCCPPCVEEFVRQAKERPETVRAPETYVKR